MLQHIRESDSSMRDRVCAALPEGAVYSAEHLGDLSGEALDSFGAHYGIERRCLSPAAINATRYWGGQLDVTTEQGEREAEDLGLLVRRTIRFEVTPLALDLEVVVRGPHA